LGVAASACRVVKKQRRAPEFLAGSVEGGGSEYFVHQILSLCHDFFLFSDSLLSNIYFFSSAPDTTRMKKVKSASSARLIVVSFSFLLILLRVRVCVSSSLASTHARSRTGRTTTSVRRLPTGSRGACGCCCCLLLLLGLGGCPPKKQKGG